jgi:Na+/H+-dicarboxylate symporter
VNARGPARSLYARWTALGLTTRIVTGLVLGIALGLFFGERTRLLEGLADGYIRLMQMTVLPYLVVALITGLGRLDVVEAKRLARRGGLALLLIWALALLVVGLMPLSFPDYDAGSFFSSSLAQPGAEISLAELYIPANPFQSMSKSVVPAVTLFSLSIGIALIGVPGKERFLEPLEALLAALGRITHFIVELTPYGVIAVAAVAAGTLAPEELERLSVYFVTFILASLILGLWLLPALVTLLTPFRYAEVVGACRDAMLTAFVTNNVFIVLPMLTEHCASLAARHGFDERSVRTVPAVIVPIAFNFPTAGKLLTLLFVPFAAWLHGSPLPVADYPQLMLNGLFSYFAKAQVALPFLLDLFEIPSDLFNLYIPTSLVNGKFDSAVGAMSLLAFTLITAASLAGRLRVRAVALARAGIVSALVLGVTLVTAHAGMEALLGAGQSKAEALRAMHLDRAGLAHGTGTAARPAQAPAQAGTLAELRTRGTLRVGYEPERLPFSFRNADGETVGFDIEMATQLARDLGLALELVPTTPDRFETDLATGTVDLIPSVRYTHHWMGRLRLSTPYMDGTLGLLVRDSRRQEFASLDAIALHEERLRIAIPGEADLYENHVREFLGSLPYELIELPSWEAVFAGPERFDAVVGLAEVGMAWSLVHPEYTVVIPRDRIVRRPLAYALSPAREELARVVDQWVVLQKARGNVDAAYDYWILGKGTERRAPRWSIARDVLGWLD